ncbi:MAG: hypothetical protein VXV96_08835 [Bdellovibrionota bacterium]|nr:hypothetical protein [Bdellovibrionota bacterium]
MYKSDSLNYLGFRKRGKAISSLEAQELCLRTNLDNALRAEVYWAGVPKPKESKRPLGHPHFKELKRSEFIKQMLSIREKRGIDLNFLKFIYQYKFHFLLDETTELFDHVINYLADRYPENFCGNLKNYGGFLKDLLDRFLLS